jgi:hypothetical protein
MTDGGEVMRLEGTIGLPVKLVILDPFEEGKTYELEGIALEVNEDIRRVKMQIGNEISWLPIDEILEYTFKETGILDNPRRIR